VTAGCAALHNKIPCSGPGLLGTDLVRLILERGRTARQAVDLLIDLVGQHGQSEPLGNPPQGDSSFLIADAKEAFAVETARAALGLSRDPRSPGGRQRLYHSAGLEPNFAWGCRTM